MIKISYRDGYHLLSMRVHKNWRSPPSVARGPKTSVHTLSRRAPPPPQVSKRFKRVGSLVVHSFVHNMCPHPPADSPSCTPRLLHVARFFHARRRIHAFEAVRATTYAHEIHCTGGAKSCDGLKTVKPLEVGSRFPRLTPLRLSVLKTAACLPGVCEEINCNPRLPASRLSPPGPCAAPSVWPAEPSCHARRGSAGARRKVSNSGF